MTDDDDKLILDERGVPVPLPKDGAETLAAVDKILRAVADGKPFGNVPERAAARLPREDPEEQRRFTRERMVRPLRMARQTIPERFRWARFDDPQLCRRVAPPSAVDLALRCRDSVLLGGPSGSGKTSLAAALMMRVIREAFIAIETGNRQAYQLGARAFFVTAYDVAKAGVHSPLGRRPELVDRCMNASYLVLDELGMDVEVYRQSATAVREVLHERHATNRPTVTTTFLTPENIRAQYGAGISRRFDEGAVINLGET